jgi:hypothetical protein
LEHAALSWASCYEVRHSHVEDADIIDIIIP